MVAIVALALGLGLYTGYRFEKRKLDTIVGARDMMYTKQLHELQGSNDQLSISSMLGKDHYIVQNGKVLFVTQATTEVKKDVVLDNQSTLTTDGVFTPKNGSKQTLSNGALIWPDGTVWVHGKSW